VAEPAIMPAPDDGPRSRKRAARAARRERAARDERAGWRDHAEAGDFKRAFRMLPEAASSASMDVSQLMLAADAARLSGHPQAALPFLERVMTAHAEDERAPLAAFTLGGVLMHQLGRPREAEAAYATARAATRSAELAQDALARQVEAAHLAGDANLARRLARAYLAQYPSGRRVHAVRRFGRL
jgi:transmembrane sensor